ncbi:MAG TPA: hypothetical protein VFG76_11605, partial [Candidatus Polarisedimenticolia bacterium]|nr:hypothetical protein [Candidatus Polarisedimenticolia bacterium]
MKALPCRFIDNDGNRCKGAKGSPGTAVLPGGRPYLIGTMSPLRFPFKYQCARCKRVTELSVQDFAGLRALTSKQLEAMGEWDSIARDWRGRGGFKE